MRIGSNLSGVDLSAYSSLLQAFDRLDLSAARLATMQRINTGKDDPAGLIAIGDLQAELAATKAASYSAARAVGMVHVDDSALAEVGELLTEIRANYVSAAGGTLSDAEIAAKQIEVDAALEAIDRIGASTAFGGRKLLQGGTLTFSFSPDVRDTSSLTLPVVHTSSLGGPDASLAELAGGRSLSLGSGNPEDAIEALARRRQKSSMPGPTRGHSRSTPSSRAKRCWAAWKSASARPSARFSIRTWPRRFPD